MLLCVLRFMGFSRFLEVINLKCLDLILKETHMYIFIKKRKADVYWEGYWMHLSKLKLALYTTILFRKYTEAAKIKESEDKLIFRRICHSMLSFKLKDLDKPISYTTVRDIFLTNLKNIGLDKTQSGFHNLGSWGKAAAASFGINDRLFQNHERWKSENVKNWYVRENLQTLLSVSKKIRFLNLSRYSCAQRILLL